MKIRYGMLVAAVLCACTLAHADSIVSGSISLLGDGACSSGGTSAAALDLSCGASSDPVWGSVTGSASSTNVQAATGLGTDRSSYGHTSFTISMDGLYTLTGGSGFGYADWSLLALNSMDGPGSFGPCSVTIDGVTELCDPEFGDETGSFYVPYNTPLQVDFTGSFDLYSSGLMEGGPGSLSFTLTNLQPTPEPASWGLVGFGMLPVLVAVAMRRRSVA